MRLFFVCSCLPVALIFVETAPLIITGHVGENVTFECSGWDVWIGINKNAKYFCKSPCKKMTDAIKSEFGKTTQKGRIKLHNNGTSLSVTFINLQKSDSTEYSCGVERTIWDPYIKVILTVTEVNSTTVTTPTRVGSTLSFLVKNTTVSLSNIITNSSASQIINSTSTPASATQGNGTLFYLVVNLSALIAILLVLLGFLKRVNEMKQKKREIQQDIQYDEIRLEDPQSKSQPGGVSNLHVSDTDSLYANCSSQPGGATNAQTVYSVIMQHKNQTEPTRQSEPNQSESYENDCLYFMAELPQVT